jgi:hypothetical protein
MVWSAEKFASLIFFHSEALSLEVRRAYVLITVIFELFGRWRVTN